MWSQRPPCLILVDGTWRQAGRIVRRADGVADLPRVSLPHGGPSRWRVRRDGNRQRPYPFLRVYTTSITFVLLSPIIMSCTSRVKVSFPNPR